MLKLIPYCPTFALNNICLKQMKGRSNKRGEICNMQSSALSCDWINFTITVSRWQIIVLKIWMWCDLFFSPHISDLLPWKEHVLETYRVFSVWRRESCLRPPWLTSWSFCCCMFSHTRRQRQNLKNMIEMHTKNMY